MSVSESILTKKLKITVQAAELNEKRKYWNERLENIRSIIGVAKNSRESGFRLGISNSYGSGVDFVLRAENDDELEFLIMINDFIESKRDSVMEEINQLILIAQ